MAWAKSSLPVPLSPVMSTGKLLTAALSASLFSLLRASLRPTMLSKVQRVERRERRSA
jgi:hypothetical protein